MNKILAISFLFVILFACPAAARIGDDTTVTITPECVDTNTTYDFEMTVDFKSPDGEGLKEVQFLAGHNWEYIDWEAPDAQSVPGSWTAQQSGSTLQWLFTSDDNDGQRGGLLDGEQAVFKFSATTYNADDMEVTWSIWGDWFGTEGDEEDRTLEETLTMDICTDDDGDDDGGDDDDDDRDDGDDDDDDDDDDGACCG